MSAASYVYILKHKTLPLVKIGKANNIFSRMATLGMDNFDHSQSKGLRVETTEQAFQLEKLLHITFDAFRLSPKEGREQVGKFSGHTEWFREECQAKMPSLLASISAVIPFEPCNPVTFFSSYPEPQEQPNESQDSDQAILMPTSFVRSALFSGGSQPNARGVDPDETEIQGSKSNIFEIKANARMLQQRDFVLLCWILSKIRPDSLDSFDFIPSEALRGTGRAGDSARSRKSLENEFFRLATKGFMVSRKNEESPKKFSGVSFFNQAEWTLISDRKESGVLGKTITASHSTNPSAIFIRRTLIRSI